MGATQMMKKQAIFLGRYVDNRGFVRQAPKAYKQMFDLSNKEKKLEYDRWVLANKWNAFANAFGRLQNDKTKSQEQIAANFNKQLASLRP